MTQIEKINATRLKTEAAEASERASSVDARTHLLSGVARGCCGGDTVRSCRCEGVEGVEGHLADDGRAQRSATRSGSATL